MSLNYEFSNLCGSVYKSGNLLFTHDGNSLISPVGNRITVFDLLSQSSRTLPVATSKDISRLQLSPSGHLLIAVDVEGRAIFINFLKRVILCEVHFQSPVRDLQFNSLGDQLAVTHKSQIQIWSIPSILTTFQPLSLLYTFTGHYDEVTCLSWSPDNHYLAAGSKDHSTRIYKIGARKEENFIPFILSGHREKIVGIYWGIQTDLNKKYSLYTLSRDGGLYIWNWHNYQQTSQREGISGEELEEKYNPNKLENSNSNSNTNTSVVTKNSKSHPLRPKLTEKHLNQIRGQFHIIKRYYFNENHSRIKSCSFHQSKENSMDLLVIGYSSGIFGLYELPECNKIHTLSISQSRINTAIINSTGQWLAFASEKLGQLLVWEWQSQTYVLKQQGHFYDINTCDFTADGQIVVTGGDDGKVKLWNLHTGFCFVTFSQHTAPITALCVSKSNNSPIVLTASNDGTVRAFDLVRYKNFRIFTSPNPAQFTSLAIDQAGEIVMASTMDPFEIYIWNLRNGKLLEILTGHEGPISSIAFSNSLNLLASASWDNTVRLWNPFQSSVSSEIFHHSTQVLAVAFRDDGKELCSSTLDGQLSFWDVENGKIKFQLECRRDIQFGRRENDFRESINNSYNTSFTSITYSSDSQYILAGGNSKFLCIYHIQSRSLLKKYSISENRSLDGVLDKLNSRFVNGGKRDNELEDSDAERDKEFSLPGAKTSDFSRRKGEATVVRSKCVKFSPTGIQFAAGTTEGLLIYSMDQSLMFDPSDLTEEITEGSLRQALMNKEYSKAMIMGLSLNENHLIEYVLRSTPVVEIKFVIDSIPLHRLKRLLEAITYQLQYSRSIEYFLYWSECLFIQKYQYWKLNSNRLLPQFRHFIKLLNQQTKYCIQLMNDNIYLLEYLSFANQANKEPKHIEDLVKENNNNNNENKEDNNNNNTNNNTNGKNTMNNSMKAKKIADQQKLLTEIIKGGGGNENESDNNNNDNDNDDGKFENELELESEEEVDIPVVVKKNNNKSNMNNNQNNNNNTKKHKQSEPTKSDNNNQNKNHHQQQPSKKAKIENTMNSSSKKGKNKGK